VYFALFCEATKDALLAPLESAARPSTIATKPNTGNMFAAHKVAATVYFRQHQLIRIDVDAYRPQALIRDPLDPRPLGGDQYPPAFSSCKKRYDRARP
jgi:hypothetical protein